MLWSVEIRNTIILLSRYSVMLYCSKALNSLERMDENTEVFNPEVSSCQEDKKALE